MTQRSVLARASDRKSFEQLASILYGFWIDFDFEHQLRSTMKIELGRPRIVRRFPWKVEEGPNRATHCLVIPNVLGVQLINAHDFVGFQDIVDIQLHSEELLGRDSQFEVEGEIGGKAIFSVSELCIELTQLVPKE